MATVQGLYLALFGRPADPINLAYFNLVTGNGADLQEMAALSNQTECSERFAGMPATAIIETIHQSLFARPADAAALAFFAGELSSGRQRIEGVATDILNGARGADLATLETRLAAADLFSASLELGARLAAYSGPAAAAIGRDYIASVTTETPGTVEMVEEAVLRLMSDHETEGCRNDLRRILLSAEPLLSTHEGTRDPLKATAVGKGTNSNPEQRFMGRNACFVSEDYTFWLNADIR